MWIFDINNKYGIGSYDNLYVFSRRPLRANPCSHYILHASLFDLLNILFSVSTRLLTDRFRIDPFVTHLIVEFSRNKPFFSA